MPDSQLIESGSLSCINEYLAIGSGGYVNEYSLLSNCSLADCFPQKSRWRWNERSAPRGETKRFEQYKDWIPRCIRTYLYCIRSIYVYIMHIPYLTVLSPIPVLSPTPHFMEIWV